MGAGTDEQESKNAITIASFLLNDTFQKLLWLNGLYLVPEHKTRDMGLGRGPAIIISLGLAPSEEQQEPT